MSYRAKNLEGIIFGKLTVLKRTGTKNKFALWFCQCSCGKQVNVRSDLLVKSNGTKSCGCIRIENSTTHGQTKFGKVSSEYRSWAAMLNRCKNKNNTFYKDYGERGITTCERWNKFENFLGDMGYKPKPTKEYSIDRIDNDKGYSKENCKWSTKKEQANNRRKHKPHSRLTIRYIKKAG